MREVSMAEVRRFELSAWNAIVGLGTGERFVRASDYDAIAAELASQVAWKERYMREVLEAAERIRALEDALRLAEPLLPPNAPWGIVNKVRKTLDRGGDAALVSANAKPGAASGRKHAGPGR
jgi:phosphoglycolate phosphatase-like HAD superfamily hydrolase